MKKIIGRLETKTSARMHKRALNEFVMGLFVVTSLIVSTSVLEFELVEGFYEFSRKYEHWELDEIVFGFIWFAVVATIYGVRRLQDIKTLNKEITHTAYYDYLTSLPNRNLALNSLQTKIETSRIQSSRFALMFLDFDHFKRVNDTYGHSSGDQLIRLVSRRLKSCLRGDEILSRLGGDEFLIIVELPNDSKDHLSDFIKRIQMCQKESFNIQGKTISTNFSLGIALYPQDASTSQELLIAADTAMYQAKKQGTGQVCFYKQEFGREIQKRHQLAAQLRKDLINDKLFLVYQPIVDSELQLVQGYEVLLRWKCDNQMISPELILDLAEETGLSQDISNWVMKKAFQESKKLLVKDQFLAINVSVTQFLYPKFIDNVKMLVEQHHFNPVNLELEITESSILNNFNESAININQLKKIGVKIAIDDFGTGYSSLSRLKHLHVDRLKIDRSFLSDALIEHKSNGIYRAIVSLANSLEIDIVAEGIETEEQVVFLSDFSPLLLQGFFFQKPARVDEQGYCHSSIIRRKVTNT